MKTVSLTSYRRLSSPQLFIFIYIYISHKIFHCFFPINSSYIDTHHKRCIQNVANKEHNILQTIRLPLESLIDINLREIITRRIFAVGVCIQSVANIGLYPVVLRKLIKWKIDKYRGRYLANIGYSILYFDKWPFGHKAGDYDFPVITWCINWALAEVLNGSDNGLVPNMRQAIIWSNAEPIHWRIQAAPGGGK